MSKTYCASVAKSRITKGITQAQMFTELRHVT